MSRAAGDPSLWSYWMNYKMLGRPALRVQRWIDQYKINAYRPKADSPFNPPIQTVVRMKELMTKHYLEGRYANAARKVAWVTSGSPAELLKSLGYFLIYPENHAALCGVRRKTEEISIEAENAGYSRDICSYARTDIGSMISGKTPVGRLPKPDLLLCCTNICQTVLSWYRALADHFKCPLVLVDTPFLYGKAREHDVRYVQRQLEDMIPIAEKVAGKKFDYNHFMEVVGYAKEASELWLEILNRSQHRPAPMTAFDGFIHMGPIVDLRGDEVTVRYYEMMIAELDRRIERGIGAIKNEKYRILWDNLPIWYRLGFFSNLLANRGVNIVVSTYTYAWGELTELIDPANPFESMAKVYLHPILNRSTGQKLDTMKKMAKEFQLDGVILHSDRSCKPYSVGQMDQRDRLSGDMGLAALLLEADHSDPRSFSDKQAESRVEAFIENMETRAA